MKIREGLAVALVMGVLAGCASGVQREAAEPGAVASRPAEAIKVSSVKVSLSPEAQKAAAENPGFNQDKFASTVKRMIEARGLMVPAQTAAQAEIVLTSFRVRSTAAAVMLGIMAGTDNVAGEVLVKDPAGKTLRKFKVNASYGLGGFAGGIDDVRLNWLYEKFGEHTVAELAGTPLKD